jgi:hypothetical protein
MLHHCFLAVLPLLPTLLPLLRKVHFRLKMEISIG